MPLGTARKAYGQLRKAALVGVLTAHLAPCLTPWHSTLFRDANSNIYNYVIRAGIRPIQQLMDKGGHMHFLPRLGSSLQGRDPETLAPPPPPLPGQATNQPLMEPKPAFWAAWNNKKMLRYLMQLRLVPPRQTPKMWKEWASVSLPDAHITFIQLALWGKQPVGTRLARWQPQGTACPLDNQQETSQHALLHCRYPPVAFRIAT